MSDAIDHVPDLDGGVPLARFDLLELADGATATSFRLDVRSELCTPFAFLYGGSGIAASVEASERATGRPLQWITTQYVGSPTPGEVVEFEVNIAAAGRATTQTQVTGSVDGQVVLASVCAHNVRPAGDENAFATMPDVPGPHDSRPFDEIFQTGVSASFFGSFERRIAAGKFAHEAVGEPQTDGLAMWVRMFDQGIGSPATQGFVADLGPLVVCASLGVPPGGTSLDNTIRVVDPTPSDWVLIDLEADGFHRSVGHSTAQLWSEDGRLLGLAQQSAIVRTSHHRR
ncbi:MAG: thioesterase family protein [Ilumatobacter sp.]|uniref:acyl-CoA thioesterase n=1 Tax=Ilumatobacter sp. TaxID=1967498 RepID=UPI00329A7E78